MVVICTLDRLTSKEAATCMSVVKALSDEICLRSYRKSQIYCKTSRGCYIRLTARQLSSDLTIHGIDLNLRQC